MNAESEQNIFAPPREQNEGTSPARPARVGAALILASMVAFLLLVADSSWGTKTPHPFVALALMWLFAAGLVVMALGHPRSPWFVGAALTFLLYIPLVQYAVIPPNAPAEPLACFALLIGHNRWFMKRGQSRWATACMVIGLFFFFFGIFGPTSVGLSKEPPKLNYDALINLAITAQVLGHVLLAIVLLGRVLGRFSIVDRKRPSSHPVPP